jgi:hypothetical protein
MISDLKSTLLSAPESAPRPPTPGRSEHHKQGAGKDRHPQGFRDGSDLKAPALDLSDAAGLDVGKKQAPLSIRIQSGEGA